MVPHLLERGGALGRLGRVHDRRRTRVRLGVRVQVAGIGIGQRRAAHDLGTRAGRPSASASASSRSAARARPLPPRRARAVLPQAVPARVLRLGRGAREAHRVGLGGAHRRERRLRLRLWLRL